MGCGRIEGDVLVAQAGRDIQVKGSEVNAQHLLLLDAGRDVAIVAGVNRETHEQGSRSKSTGVNVMASGLSKSITFAKDQRDNGSGTEASPPPPPAPWAVSRATWSLALFASNRKNDKLVAQHEQEWNELKRRDSDKAGTSDDSAGGAAYVKSWDPLWVDALVDPPTRATERFRQLLKGMLPAQGSVPQAVWLAI